MLSFTQYNARFYFLWQTSYIVFLGFFSYALLTGFGNEVTWVEILMYVWVFCLMLDEVREVCLNLFDNIYTINHFGNSFIILYHSVAAYICNSRLKETARSKFLFGATLCGASVFLRQVELFWHHHSLLLYNRCDIRLTWVLWNRGSRPGLPSYKFNSLLYAYPESFLSSWRVRTQSLDDCFYGKYKTILFSKLMFFMDYKGGNKEGLRHLHMLSK